MTPSEIEEHGKDDQSSDTEEEDGSSESALEALVKKRKNDLVEGERALKKAMFKKREKDQACGERALQKATLRFEEEKGKVYGDATPSDVLHLNVGGTNMVVLRGTLTSVPGSMLASKFSGRWDDSIERDRDGNFFIDHLSPAFELMVNHLRAKACQPPNAPPVAPPEFTKISTVSESDFHLMLEYYGMVLGIYVVKFTLLFGNPSNVEYKDGLTVNVSDLSTFEIEIEAEGHKFNIRSFEVTILKVERAQIGWKEREPTFRVSRGNGKRNGTSCIDSKNGVGDVDGTVALDCCRSVMLVNGAALPIEGTCKEGSTIRYDTRGKWYIDGQLVASTDKSDNVTLIGNYSPGPRVAAISAKGSLYVSNVECFSRGQLKPKQASGL